VIIFVLLSFSGGMQDYNYLHSNCFEITIELSCCKYPKSTELAKEWDNNKEALLSYMEEVRERERESLGSGCSFSEDFY